MNVSALVFDLDGTLSDPSEGVVACVNYALEKGGYALHTPAEISAEIGPPLDLMFAKFIPGISMDEIKRLVMFYRERFGTDGFAENRLYSGMRETIQWLHAQGFALGVCTSKPEPAARIILEHFGLLEYMGFVSGGDIGIKKQSQLKKLLDEKSIDTNAVMIGDRGVDLSAAHNNGLRAVAVLWGFGEASELAAENPELTLAEVKQLTHSFEQSG
jgi:phosphoglycolate phosphatase